MGLIIVGHSLIPLSEGLDPMDASNWSVQFFLFPFLAHAIGTLAGAFATAKIAVSKQMILAFVIGLFFLAGGITMVAIMPAPLWFVVADLLLAYIPMGWLGWKLSGVDR